MRKVLVLARREVAAYLFSWTGYIVAGLFLMVSAFLFFWGIPFLNVYPIFRPGAEATLRPLFEVMAFLMVLVTPLLTMRLLSEEYRSGTIEVLATAPVSDTAVVLGKFLGVLAFYLFLVATSAVFLALLLIYGQPDPGAAVMGYVGMVLLGAAFLSVGVFASALTRSQALAAIVGMVLLSVFAVLMQVVVVYASSPWNSVAAQLNAITYFKEFARGLFDTRGLVFFLSITVFFLFLSVKTLESKRWR